MLSPGDLLHLNRLRYCKRLLQHCPEVLWNLLHALEARPDSWISSLRTSFAWLERFLGPGRLPRPDAPITDWWSFLRLDVNWKTKLRKAKLACLAFRKAEAEGLTWEKSIEAQLSS